MEGGNSSFRPDDGDGRIIRNLSEFKIRTYKWRHTVHPKRWKIPNSITIMKAAGSKGWYVSSCTLKITESHFSQRWQICTSNSTQLTEASSRILRNDVKPTPDYDVTTHKQSEQSPQWEAQISEIYASLNRDTLINRRSHAAEYDCYVKQRDFYHTTSVLVWMLDQLNGLYVWVLTIRQKIGDDSNWRKTDSEEVNREWVSSAQRSYFDDTLSITGIGDRHRLRLREKRRVYWKF
jgi:hypothetical protein